MSSGVPSSSAPGALGGATMGMPDNSDLSQWLESHFVTNSPQQGPIAGPPLATPNVLSPLSGPRTGLTPSSSGDQGLPALDMWREMQSEMQIDGAAGGEELDILRALEMSEAETESAPPPAADPVEPTAPNKDGVLGLSFLNLQGLFGSS